MTKMKTESLLVLNYISAPLLKANWIGTSLGLFGNCFLPQSKKLTA